jgi:uncharacterized membrane protein
VGRERERERESEREGGRELRHSGARVLYQKHNDDACVCATLSRAQDVGLNPRGKNERVELRRAENRCLLKDRSGDARGAQRAD